ncbi:hypothetical protein [Saccharopolyspora phatthalungensis]|uniref:Uncharacterized protein n=1 Tax=Saccharopolyspora phatthalungensis TaxID=664693 RepID=A0A840QGI5_9PSEU|nr:hypothetical protein [Saccharopolyspora phatthalungensis]MBB5159964.1 hypothetical protein [Saccharopolyspora phatthalungensis]
MHRLEAVFDMTFDVLDINHRRLSWPGLASGSVLMFLNSSGG